MTGAVGLLAIPVLISTSGAVAWSSIALGQTVGGIAAILIALGWGVTGPATVAKASEEGRFEEFNVSVRVRLRVLPVVMFFIVMLALIASPSSYELICVLSSVAYSLAGMGYGWFFVGLSRPGLLLLGETMPRMIGSTVGLTAVWFSHVLWLYPLAVLIGIATSVLVSHVIINKIFADFFDSSKRIETTESLKRQLRAVSTALVASVYLSAPLVLVSLFYGSALTQFAVGDRMLKLSLTASSPFTQSLQGWIPRANNNFRSRFRKGLSACSVLSTALFVILAVAGPELSRLLTKNSVIITYGLSIPVGLALGFSLMSQITGLVGLVQINRTDLLLRSAALGACVGLATLFLLAGPAGAAGVAWSVAVAEFVVVGVQLWHLRRLLYEKVYIDHALVDSFWLQE